MATISSLNLQDLFWTVAGEFCKLAATIPVEDEP
jgi:hypothetical protein